jgi:putative resolvase
MYVPSRTAAKYYNCNKRTLTVWCSRGTLDFKSTPGGQRRYYIPDEPKEQKDTRSRICYCRVSSGKQRDDLERQVSAMRSEFPEHDIVTDVGSGINFKRKGLLSILERAYRGEVEEVVVAHRDRLARFASELIEWQLRLCGTKLLVQHHGMGTPESELAEDVLSIVTIFACRQNGRRRYKKTETSESV